MASILIIYYSRKGENYWAGSLRDLEKGNTEIAAEMIQEAVGGDLFEVETVKPYSASYHTCTEEAQRELRENARPELKACPENIAEYDTIFVGYPNWWGEAPSIVWNFVESSNLAGKTIIPFCTSYSSPFGTSGETLEGMAPDANWITGMRFGEKLDERAVIQWVDGLELDLST